MLTLFCLGLQALAIGCRLPFVTWPLGAQRSIFFVVRCSRSFVVVLPRAATNVIIGIEIKICILTRSLQRRNTSAASDREPARGLPIFAAACAAATSSTTPQLLLILSLLNRGPTEVHLAMDPHLLAHHHRIERSVLQYLVQDSCPKPIIDVTCCAVSLISPA